MQVHPRAPHGMELINAISATGEGMENIALTERVYTSRLGVVSKLPKSGAALDWLFLILTGMFGIGQSALQMKRKLLLA